MSQITAPTENKLYFVKRDSDTWNDMWNRFVRTHFLRFGTSETTAHNKEYSEVWQYMGTVHKPTGEAEHQFRHRMHPKTQKREHLCIQFGQMTEDLMVDIDTL